MTAYERNCESNRYLFGLLEQLTHEIAFLTLKGKTVEAEHLQQQKDGVRALIDVNLAKMDVLWKVMRPASRHEGQIEPTLQERSIILSYQHNPNQPLSAIATKLRCNQWQVSRAVEKLLNNQFLNV